MPHGPFHQERARRLVLDIRSAKPPPIFRHLTWANFLFGNLVPVTIGNIIGGSVMVGAVYWFVYLRKKQSASS